MMMSSPSAPGQTDPAIAFVENLRSVFLRASQVERLRRSFKDHAAKVSPFGYEQLTVLQQYATPSAEDMIDHRLSFIWHFFDDHIRKGVCVQDLTRKSLSTDILARMAVRMDWTMHNYPMIFHIEPKLPAPAYPAPAEDVADAPAALGYMGFSLLPALKRILAQRHGCSEQELETRLGDLSRQMMNDEPGFEILRPVPPALWKGLKTLPPPHP